MVYPRTPLEIAPNSVGNPFVQSLSILDHKALRPSLLVFGKIYSVSTGISALIKRHDPMPWSFMPERLTLERQSNHSSLL